MYTSWLNTCLPVFVNLSLSSKFWSKYPISVDFIQLLDELDPEGLEFDGGWEEWGEERLSFLLSRMEFIKSHKLLYCLGEFFLVG